MRQLLLIMVLGLFACGKSVQDDTEKVYKQVEIKEDNINLPTVGEKVQGDFDGDGQMEFATALKIREGQGNPVEDGTPDEYAIQFSVDNLKTIELGCCEILLINEGDLNQDGADDISVFQAPMNGCMYTMTTYAWVNGNWKQIVESFLIPTNCEKLSNEELQKRIFKEDNAIYHYDTDLNDGNLVKKKVIAN